VLFPELENVKGAVEAEVVEAIPSFEAATIEDENVAMLEKAEEDVTGELEIFEEIGVVLRFDDALLAVSWAVDLASAIASPVPNNKLLAGFATVFVLSDLVAATIEVLEPKLNVGIAGIGDETGGLVLDGANVVDTVDGAKLTSGLSIGVTFDNFDDDGSEKPLLRLAVVDAADAKWKGAAEGNTLSDDLWTSSVLSLSLPPSKLVMSNVVGLVTLSPSLASVFTSAVFVCSESGVLDCLRPNIEDDALISLSSLFEASGNCDTELSRRVPEGTCGNLKPLLLSEGTS
jgi:hypothetical protein